MTGRAACFLLLLSCGRVVAFVAGPTAFSLTKMRPMSTLFSTKKRRRRRKPSVPTEGSVDTTTSEIFVGSEGFVEDVEELVQPGAMEQLENNPDEFKKKMAIPTDTPTPEAKKILERFQANYSTKREEEQAYFDKMVAAERGSTKGPLDVLDNVMETIEFDEASTKSKRRRRTDFWEDDLEILEQLATGNRGAQEKKERKKERRKSMEEDEPKRGFINGILDITDKDGNLKMNKVVELGAWLGIFAAVAWEIYLNSPLFSRSAPMAPVIFDPPDVPPVTPDAVPTPPVDVPPQ